MKLDYVHTLRIGFVPKYFYFVIPYPHSLRNAPELIVHMWLERKSYNSPETSNIVPTAGKYK